MPRRASKPLKALPPDPARVETVRRALLAWYDREKRDLPWRGASDPYAVLVSEFMLQQTQVATAIPYFERFMKRFPTIRDLAASDEQDVLQQWAGLGYYSRARNLRQAARKIVVEYDGRVPDRVGDLLFLPGVGRYVAGAVASIAYGTPAPALDANVVRVLSRLIALREEPDSMRVRRELETLDERLLDPSRPGDFNQAMMELGALVCRAKAPLCGGCPLRDMCEATAAGAPESFPPAPARRETVAVEEACAAVRDDRGRLLVVQRPADRGRYRGMWQFPHVEIEANEDAGEALAGHLREAWGVEAEIGEEWAEIRHQVTHHRIRKRVFLARLTGANGAGREDVRWANNMALRETPMGAPHKRILALLEEGRDMFML